MTEAVTSPDAAELQAFRDRARSWLEANATRRRRPADGEQPEAGEPQGASEADMVTRAKSFQAALHDAGLAGITWPAEYGGQGLGNRYQQVFNEEAAGYELPTAILTIGMGMCGPTILAVGSEEQRRRYIRPLLRADEVWCQLFSEPGAGSDVASLQSRAERDGDEWILNGQKVWTSGAHYSDFGAVLARTDPDLPKHRGLTMFIVDMHAPGITVRPLRQINGGSNFNEVFFDDVRMPADAVLGEVNEGWRAAIAMLMNERVAIGTGTGGGGRGTGVRALMAFARDAGRNGEPVVRQNLADLYIRETILGYVGLRIRDAVKSGRPPGPEGSIAKLAGAELARRMGDVAIELAGAAGIAWPAGDRRGGMWAQAVLGAPGMAIAGGTNEVQRNIIGERVLGLPKEPQVDREVPFRDLLVGTQRGR